MGSELIVSAQLCSANANRNSSTRHKSAGPAQDMPPDGSGEDGRISCGMDPCGIRFVSISDSIWTSICDPWTIHWWIHSQSPWHPKFSESIIYPPRSSDIFWFRNPNPIHRQSMTFLPYFHAYSNLGLCFRVSFTYPLDHGAIAEKHVLELRAILSVPECPASIPWQSIIHSWSFGNP